MAEPDHSEPLPHACRQDEVLDALQVTQHGLRKTDVDARIKRYGRNLLPKAKLPGPSVIFLRQFKSPLIYVLTAAAVLSIVIQEWSDAGFIIAVLLINALIGAAQEYSAQKAANALQEMVATQSLVLRDGETYAVDSRDIVPGDVVLLESGDKVPADVRLLTSHDLDIDESSLTGESYPVRKTADSILEKDAFLGDRTNMGFAGTVVARGRAQGVVTATGLYTELGHIASQVLHRKSTKAPLLLRMERFTHRIAIIVGVAALIFALIALSRGMPLTEIFMMAVALAVSVIPEGLPVALTVALAIGMRRMAKRNVIIRKLVAVESLGSCTFIATDKTGTLTVNQLTARRIVLADDTNWDITGDSTHPRGQVVSSVGQLDSNETVLLEKLCCAAVLTNDGYLARRNSEWVSQGDAVDVALLIMSHKAGIVKAEVENALPTIDTIPFESERLFSATLNNVDGDRVAFVKGAFEVVIQMCDSIATVSGTQSIDREHIERQATTLAQQGYRVIALASGKLDLAEDECFGEMDLSGLVFRGLIGLIDPLRPEAKAAVMDCQKAGIGVAMVTGDHAATAFSIAEELGLANNVSQVMTGPDLLAISDAEEMDDLINSTRVFARVAPTQKLDIVQSLQRSGHYVAASGDGANDAPALKAAHVGVAMGKSGTDVARETADLIITDDNFASIVAGVEEGRVAYANVRKVIFLLISTGAAELVLFTLSLLTGQPLPLLAVQLLWLNLVTNGIQDVALAFEPAEGDELSRPPRAPGESIFNRIMIERVLVSAIVMGVVAFLLFKTLLTHGYTVDEARNGTLLLMVLFENIHVFNCRSETRSVFQHRLLLNPILLIGTVIAQVIHIAAMYTPWLSDVLRIQPVSLNQWTQLLAMALTVLVAMELHKVVWNRFRI